MNCSNDDNDDDFDEDNGTCNVLQNNVALNVFLDNELASSSSLLKDYYELADISNTSLCGECLLISLYVHHLYVTQPKNFSRIMKWSNWLTTSMFTKLLDISQMVREKFGRNNVSRGHWDEIELMRHLISRGCIAERGCSPKLPMLNMRRENSNYDVSTYPMFVLKYP